MRITIKNAKHNSNLDVQSIYAQSHWFMEFSGGKKLHFDAKRCIKVGVKEKYYKWLNAQSVHLYQQLKVSNTPNSIDPLLRFTG